ncbi:fibronectin type III domain-containing protein [Photorhabdus temperata]|uniref:Fibronectin type-III domain-containing protein n=1 Tax=Photorhabdus temperata J3 TaxID=1389415 RepID=U7QYX0_PHOTE|nr:fibronectin type III domain-containing protein [Photorhabdus temperata]ERT12232.1 hypothetical protein O185_15320 [Photorhabdus temperata J3]
MGIRFEVKANFDWCKIFDGEMRSPMQCQLALFNSYSLIYIDMTAKQAEADNLNIFKLLNHAFHLDLPEKEAPLLIQDAGFFTFSNHANPPETEKLCNIFPQIPLPKSVTEMETPVSHSCTFWLTLRLKGNYLFNNLIEVGVKNGDLPQADISLWGRLDRGISAGESIKQSRYIAVLPNFKLFKIFGFNNLILKYQFDNYAKYEIKGIITLDLFQKTYRFDGALSADEKQVQASLQICDKDSENTIHQPFNGGMTGITFNDLSFGIDYTFAVPEKKQPKVGLYWVKGTINYAKLLALSGSIYLLDNTPILASVAINKDLSIHDIFEASFSDSGSVFSWPSDFIDIVFHPGSNLYYRRKTDGDIKQENAIISSLAEKSLLLNQDITNYQPGFHLHALFDITLIETLKLKGDMQITKEGVNAEIQLLNPISLFILQITGFGQDPGPTLFFSTVKENKFSFRCGLLFFKHDFGLNVEVSGVKDKTGKLKISGSLSSDKIASPLLPSSAKLGFSYSKSEGFKITDWPAFNLDNNQFINFIEELKKFSHSKGSNCGQLTQFVNEHLLTSKFSISPSFNTKTDTSSQNDQLYFVLDGKYTMAMAGTDFVTLSFPKSVEFLLPSNLSLEELPNAIGAALKSAAESFIQGLLKNREAIAIFLTLTAAEKAADYAMTLLCEGLIDAALTETIQTGAEALAAAGGVAAGAAVIGDTINKIKNEIDSKPVPPDPPKPANPKPPENLSAIYGDHKAKFTWNYTENADGYQVKLKAPNGKVLFDDKQNHNDNSFISSIGPELAAGVYIWSVAATKKGFTSSESQLQQHRLTIPELNINLEMKPTTERDINLILKWNLVTDASHYNVKIEENGQTKNLSIAAPQSSETIIFDKLKPAGKYRFSLAALNNPNYIASEFCQVQEWLRLDTPQQIQANYQSGGIEIQWQCCPGVTHYLLSLQDPNGTWIHQQTVNSTTGQAHIDLPPIPIAGTYQLYLASMPDTDTAATSRQIPSIWSDGVAIQVVITPEQIAQSAYQQQMSGNDCGKLIIKSFPYLKTNMLATAMAQAGYIAVETGQGLKSAYPSISASEITEILLAIYGKALTLEQLAQKAYDELISGNQCGKILITEYPATSAKALGNAMVLAGYPATETGRGLKSAYPSISASEMAAALLEIYGRQ